MSFATLNTSKMELTPMRVNFRGVDLGGTLGNVEVTSEYDLADILSDQSGSTVRDKRVAGQKYEITTKLTQIRDKNTWKTVFPYAKLITSGPNQMMYFDAAIGSSAVANSGVLILHPLSISDADLSGDYKFFKATANAKSKITYGPKDQVSLEIVWEVFPDDGVQPERFFIHGDPSIGIVNASAAAAVAGGGNVGNGTIGSITVVNGITKTETITLTLVTPQANAGVFEVHGSLSGALGLATVGVGFSSSVISFLAADGSTDFALGDSFTIATTAANYA